VFEWDEDKRRENLAKHSVDFTAIDGFDWSRAITREDKRVDYGENRFRTTGRIGERVYARVFTSRNGRVRIISLRKANSWERRRWDAKHEN
jgi:uncharacterized DUF497 family protein